MSSSVAVDSRINSLIDGKREDLINLTQDLIRIPTLNPPGDCYLEICEYLQKRLSKSGFETELIRAKDCPGDSDKYPRWNIVAQRRKAFWPMRTFQFPHRCRRNWPRLDQRSFWCRDRRRFDLWARHLRYERRIGLFDHCC